MGYKEFLLRLIYEVPPSPPEPKTVDRLIMPTGAHIGSYLETHSVGLSVESVERLLYERAQPSFKRLSGKI